ncbi:MAG: glycosyltransferase family 2 protein [Hymenobacter sp.]|nr:MAG: glycosyltransferase family 2 protein [Hymenobacter sp.]
MASTSAPYFSIVMPCYNRADLIGGVVAAVLHQKYPDFELLLIDDGSRDNLREVATAIADPRVRYFYKENGERGAARNYGAQHARGRYVNFFDSDDEMYPNHLLVVKQYVKQHGEVEVVHTGYERLDERNRLVAEMYEWPASTNELLLYDNPFACNSVFVRRDVALANPFVEDRRLASAEDWELWLRLACQYPLHPIRQKTFCLREHSGRSLNNIAPSTVRQRDELFGQLVKENVWFVKRFPGHTGQFVADRHTFIALMLALSKQHRAATLHSLWQALRHDPSVLWRRRFLASLKHLL